MRHPRFQFHLLFTIVYATFPPPFRRLGGGESPRVAAAQGGSATSTETVPAGPRDGAGESHRFSQSSTSHKLILMASSTRSMVCLESRPTFFWSRDRSTDRIWLTVTAERFGKPLSAGSITTSLGNGGSENWELCAACLTPISHHNHSALPIHHRCFGGAESYFSRSPRRELSARPSP